MQSKVLLIFRAVISLHMHCVSPKSPKTDNNLSVINVVVAYQRDLTVSYVLYRVVIFWSWPKMLRYIPMVGVD